MSQKVRLSILLFFSITLIVLHRIFIGAWLPQAGLASFWLTCGLLLLIISLFLVEPFFSSPKDAIANSTAIIVSLLSIGDQSHFILWKAMLLYGVIVFLISVTAAYVLEKHHTNNLQKNISNLLFKISSLFGKGTTIFSVVFLLSVFSYFSTQSKSFLILMLFWALIIVFTPLGLHRLFEALLGLRRKPAFLPIGHIASINFPNMLTIELVNREALEVNQLCFRKYSTNMFSIYVSPEKFEFMNKHYAKLVYLGLYGLNPSLQSHSAEKFSNQIEENLFYKATSNQSYFDLSQNPILKENSLIGGVAISNTTIAQLVMEITTRDHSFEEGVLVKSLIGNKRVFYQITNGYTDSYEIKEGTKSFIRGIAQQIGVWDSNRKVFEAMGWMPEIGQPIFIEKRHEDFDINNCEAIPNRYIVGTIPKSNFPIHVDLDTIVTHHTAILGVTGSGKSCTTYNLIEALAAKDVKVICLDISGDYIKHLRGALDVQPIPAQMTAFLTGTNKIGVVDMTKINHSSTLPQATSSVMTCIFNWVKANLPSQIGDVKAKVCIVFEEAHSLIPEWNTCNVPSDRDKVNETSRLILQGRKYGLGCIVVTQRTANVTKTILNQCNSIFALQSFDKTGIEFLINYMGEGYTEALSVLQFRHCVLFGKASSSKRPVIVELRERDFTHLQPVADSSANQTAQ